MVVCVTYCMAGDDDDGGDVVTNTSVRILTMNFQTVMFVTSYCMAGLALLAMCMSLIQEGLMIKVLFLTLYFSLRISCSKVKRVSGSRSFGSIMLFLSDDFSALKEVVTAIVICYKSFCLPTV